MAIRFLTDSTADILPAEAARQGIDVVPLKVLFGEEAYRDGIDLDHETFYKMLAEAEKLPTTSQPTPEDFMPYFEKAKADGDQLICLLLAANLSGTCQSALIARDMCEYDGIYVIDSTQTVMGLRILVDLGLRLREEGKSAETIVAELEQAKDKIRLLAIVDTLEYLHKGGRLSAAVKVVGSLMKMKPIITLKEGAVGMAGKGVGVKGSLAAIMKLIGEELNYDRRLPVYYGYTAEDSLCQQLMAQTRELYGEHPTRCYSVGAVIGTHAGPGAAVIVYLEK